MFGLSGLFGLGGGGKGGVVVCKTLFLFDNFMEVLHAVQGAHPSSHFAFLHLLKYFSYADLVSGSRLALAIWVILFWQSVKQ